jgi:hypothetical protein
MTHLSKRLAMVDFRILITYWIEIRLAYMAKVLTFCHVSGPQNFIRASKVTLSKVTVLALILNSFAMHAKCMAMLEI